MDKNQERKINQWEMEITPLPGGVLRKLSSAFVKTASFAEVASATKAESAGQVGLIQEYCTEIELIGSKGTMV